MHEIFHLNLKQEEIWTKRRRQVGRSHCHFGHNWRNYITQEWNHANKSKQQINWERERERQINPKTL